MSTSSFSEYLMIGEAAKYLGVSPSTIRNWTRDGKLKARRHPINGYRLFDRNDLRALLECTHRSSAVHSTGNRRRA